MRGRGGDGGCEMMAEVSCLLGRSSSKNEWRGSWVGTDEVSLAKKKTNRWVNGVEGKSDGRL